MTAMNQQQAQYFDSSEDDRQARRAKAELEAMKSRGNSRYLRQIESLQVAQEMHMRGFNPEEIEMSTGIPIDLLEVNDGGP